jgi:biopolymer transport protein ExbB
MNRRQGLFIAGMVLLGSLQPVTARPITTVAAEYRQRRDEAVASLQREREEIQEEKLALALILREQEEKVAALREETRRLRQLREGERSAHEQLKSRVEALRYQHDWITGNILPEYIALWESSLTPAAWSRYRADIEAYRQQAGADETAAMTAGLRLLEISRRQVQESFGGVRYEGEALDADGRIHTGRYMEFGPLLVFAGASMSGPAVTEHGSLLPSVLPLPGRRGDALRAVIASGKGVLPVDPSGAGVLSGSRESVLDRLGKGGIWVFPILAFAGVATVVGFIKSIQVFSIRRPEAGLIQHLITHIRNAEPDRARALAAGQPAPIGPMLAAAAVHADEPPELIEEIMYEAMLDTQPKLESGLNVIAVTAATAPLLGLLGTVTGIIKTFNLMSIYGAGDPRPLISGISEALVTTELGLLLAIPALIIHALLQRRVSAIMADMEKHAVTLLNGLARKAS